MSDVMHQELHDRWTLPIDDCDCCSCEYERKSLDYYDVIKALKMG